MRFKLVELLGNKLDKPVDTPTAFIFDIKSQEDEQFTKETIKKIMKANGYDGNADIIYASKKMTENTTPAKELLRALDKDGDGLKQALYILDGVNVYRVEMPIYTVDKWVQDGLATSFPNNNSEMMFQKLKRTFQEYCQEKELPYTSWVNE